MIDQDITPAIRGEIAKDFDREQFLEHPECQGCYKTMSLEPDCEWPDDPRLLLCRECLFLALQYQLGFRDHFRGMAEYHGCTSITEGFVRLDTLRKVMQEIWTFSEMGYLVGGLTPGIKECGLCGAKGPIKEAVAHDEGCLQGIVEKATVFPDNVAWVPRITVRMAGPLHHQPAFVWWTQWEKEKLAVWCVPPEVEVVELEAQEARDKELAKAAAADIHGFETSDGFDILAAAEERVLAAIREARRQMGRKLAKEIKA
jgi:hypothetical protein